jgi:deoxyribonuclease-4
LIENTAGQGDVLGSGFEELAELLGGIAGELAAGFCIDTAHLFAAGYPIHTARGLNHTVLRFDATVGLDKVRLVHANDSKTAFESHCDRHAHIGEGYIGAEAFRRIVRHPKLRQLPFICETPVDKPGDDQRNLETLRRLAQPEKEGVRSHEPGVRIQEFEAQERESRIVPTVTANCEGLGQDI